MPRFIGLLCLFLLAAPHATAERLTPEKLWDLARIGDAAVSPDGTTLAYLVTRYDLAENGSTASLMLLPLDTTIENLGKTGNRVATGFDTPLAAAKPIAVLRDVKGMHSLGWLPHSSGDKLVYISPGAVDSPNESSADPESASDKPDDPDADKDDGDGDDSDDAKAPQAFLIAPEAGAEPKQLTFVADGIANLKPSPSGTAIAFTVDIKLDRTVNELYEDLPKADARIIDGLLYRHWNQWHDYKYSHLHLAPVDAAGNAGPPVDLMGSMKADCPVPPFGGSEQFEFSPSGKQIALTLKLVNNPAESTDTNVFVMDLDRLLETSGDDAEGARQVDAEGTRKRRLAMRNLTPGMPGYDMEPRYSPDGSTIAFHSMRRASFESDRNRIMKVSTTGLGLVEITSGLDQTAHNATWSDDSKALYFSSETRGTDQIYRIDADASELSTVSSGRFNFAIVGVVPQTRFLVVRQQNMLRPTELALLDTQSTSVTTITDVNGDLYKKLELPRIEERFFTATDGKKIQNWVILPPDYDENTSKKWPLLTYCQGGPQGQIGQWFSYRWNFHLMAAKGYVVHAVNRRGLPGFGRQWNDQISGDWGGQAMQDILASVDGMIADPSIDPKRVGAVGASFGGYTVYWLMGNAGSRYAAMISHCGVYNLESMYGATEELFFVNWDLGGPYWKSQEVADEYRQFSPHQFAGNWKTPLLVIHGEKDFRVPVTQGMEAFTAAQVQGVPSRFLYFPEEGHWVMSPQNGVLWGRVFFDWLDQHLAE
ncbi:MAG: prolyl oligopeptidase family serine peptidase [Planctomycetota bacterium]